MINVIIIVYEFVNIDELLWKGAFSSLGKFSKYLDYELEKLEKHDKDAYYSNYTHVDGGSITFHYNIPKNPKTQYTFHYRILSVDTNPLPDNRLRLVKSD